MNETPETEPESEPGAGGAPSAEEEELRRRIEEQMRQLRIQDLLLESLAGILQLTARRIEKEDERDLAQARVGIDAARAVVDLLEPGPAAQVRSAIAELQMRFARAAGGARGEPSPAPAEEGPGGQSGAGEEPPPRLWTPPGATE